MKIICIDDRWRPTDGKTAPPHNPQCSEIVTVIKDEKGLYFLAEYLPNVGYDKAGFAPLSLIDEKELIKKRELQKA